MDGLVRIKVLERGSRCGVSSFLFRGRYLFIHDAACRDYDWLLVLDELPRDDVGSFVDGREPLGCPRTNTILLTQEPVSIKTYGRAYTRQFGYLLTNRPFAADRHPGYRLGRGYMLWFYGKDYDAVVTDPPPAKTKLISTCCSSKQMRLTRHHDRFVLTSYLAANLPCFDWFGHGVRRVEHKYEALDPYKYHLAVENHIAPYHWTEKLSDPILARCLTFYAGDPAIAECLPPESFIPVPLDNPPRALAIIKASITADEYSKRLPSIEEARRRILEKYNPWAQVAAIVDSAPPTVALEPRRGGGACEFVSSRHRLRRNPFVAISDGLSHLIHLR